MKHIIASILVCGSITGSIAQTNTFPATGAVGIGTTNPAALLDVLTDLPTPGSYESQYWTTNNSSYNLRLHTVWNDDGINYSFFQKFGGIDFPSLSFFKGNVNIGTNLGIGTTSPNGIYSGDNKTLHLNAPANFTSEFVQSNNQGSITHYLAGTVAKAGVYSAAALAYDIELNAVSRFYISTTGKIGIGTTTPATKLHVYGIDNADWVSMVENGSTGGHRIFSGYNNGTTRYGLYIEGGGDNSASFDLLIGPSDNRKFLVRGDGNVGIGTSSPQSKLAVNGDIYAKKIKVTQTGWPDYVFTKEYSLKPLSEVEAYIMKFNHLPEVPSAEEVAKNDLDLGEMNKILLMKVEELTLYMINLEKREAMMEAENKLLQQRIQTLELQQQ